MVNMKEKIFYLKIVVLIIAIFDSVSFADFNIGLEQSELCLEENISFSLVEKNIIAKSFISFLYKDDENNYLSRIYDYENNIELELNNLIKEDKMYDYNKKVEELLYLKYPKFIVSALIKDDVKKSYVFRDNEMVIYYNEYEIKPEVEEILYLKINYNEIKEFINFTVLLDSEYENENGYNYTNAKKAVAITFDDSPSKNKTNKILNYLKDNHFHATFFVVGEKAIYNKDLLISIKNSGNEIGSHSYSHQNFGKLDDNEIVDDYNKMNNIYKGLFNEDLKYMRPPYGIIKDNQLNLVNVSYILWSLDTNDWRYRNKDYLVNYVVNHIKDGDILLFHDSYNSTVDAIEELLPILYSKGYQVMSVSELFELKGLNVENNKIYNSAK